MIPLGDSPLSEIGKPEAHSKATAEKQRLRRKALQSGFSLLARGEPQIWFTGGMLAICLGMIVSLMALILASGLPTFWPRPVDWLALRDGSFEIGEPQSVAPSAAELDSSDADADAKSYYYRTENFDITNQHYRWLESDELNSAGIFRVPHATLVERVEWGYLFGLPLRLHELLHLSGNDQEQLNRLRNAQQLLAFIASTASGTNLDAEVDSEKALAAAALTRAQEYFEHKLTIGKDAQLRRNLALTGESIKQVQVAGDSTWRNLEDIASDVIVDAVRVVEVDSDRVAQRVQAALPEVEAQRQQLAKLKHQLSRLDANISQLRIAVRQAELDTDSILPVQLAAAHYTLEQLQSLARQTTHIDSLKRQLPDLIEDSALAGQLQLLCERFVAIEFPAQRELLEQSLSDWRLPLSDAPVEVRDSVDRYITGYSDIVMKKEPIQQSIIELQATMATGEIIFAVPSSARPISELSAEDVVSLSRGVISDGTSVSLNNLGIQVDKTSGQVVYAQGPVTLVAITDADRLNHLISTTDSSYLVEGTTSSSSLLGEHAIAYEQLVRVVPVNQLTLIGKLSVYFSRWGEFLFDEPREANTLGGVFPAIWGTIVMTLIMTIAVVPFGVMAALYLREYTRPGPLVSLIRISINNLAGVPSIVYGVFGFSFFCMTIGTFIDGGPAGADIVPWPSATWYLVLSITAIVGTAAFFASFLSSGPSHSQTQFTRVLSRAALFLWLCSLGATVLLIFKSPFFEGFYAAQLPNPTFGKGGLLWASLTLALLTLPVVIVATEEALSAVPNSLREGSLACGASKWQTIRRIVLPHARPGILTGAILAMARGAGEVAPLMLVGALPNAPELPLDGEFPFFHGSRNFMHLGYQIYSLGFQSQNSEAAKPMVFTCTLLLIIIVAALNLSAVFLRTRLRRRFAENQF